MDFDALKFRASQLLVAALTGELLDAEGNQRGDRRHRGSRVRPTMLCLQLCFQSLNHQLPKCVGVHTFIAPCTARRIRARYLADFNLLRT